MNWLEIARRLDPDAARAFVTAAANVIDAMLIEAERIEQTQTPGTRDYNAANLSRAAPSGGWISQIELRATARKMSEAIAAEKWVEGVVFAVKALAAVGAV
ncbi:hypothetical protein RAS1_20360 [Phycisphaerae bacterium RAS1]|nr:hypothetical protein RAS1_20360 [Phycisphaerae bacterium RAS1]